MPIKNIIKAGIIETKTVCDKSDCETSILHSSSVYLFRMPGNERKRENPKATVINNPTTKAVEIIIFLDLKEKDLSRQALINHQTKSA